MTTSWRRHAPRVGVPLAALLAAAIATSAKGARPDPLVNTLPSPEAVAAAVMEAMSREDLERLRALALGREEFRAHVWPHLPASQPGRNVPFDFIWDMLQQNSEGHLRQTVARFEEAPVLLRVEFAGNTTTYGDVIVHRDAELVVADGSGEARIHLFGSMIERKGRWKVFSYIVND